MNDSHTDREPCTHAGKPAFTQSDADAIIMGLAARQHGVVARRQLLAAGVPMHVIEYRLKRGRLQALYRSVYRLGPVVARYEREMAAVLACGGAAVLACGGGAAVTSYRSAAAVWGTFASRRADARVDVTIADGFRAPGPGVCVHRVAAMPADEITQRDGLPLTTPARTLLDLARVVDLRDLERALSLADRQGLVDRDGIVVLLRRYARRRGTPALRTLIGDGSLPALTRSEAEAQFLALIDRARLRAPEVNVVVKGYEVDCLWRAERLVAEIDGFAFHSSPEAFERDRRRDAVLTAAGFRVMRVTWRQLTGEPEALLVSLAQALSWRRLPVSEHASPLSKRLQRGRR